MPGPTPQKRPPNSAPQKPFHAPGGTPGRRKTRFMAGAFTVGVHLAGLALLLIPRGSTPHPQVPPEPDLVQVSVMDTPKPQPPGPPDVQMAQPEAAPSPMLPHVTVARVPVPVAITKPDNSDLLSASQLAGAAAVGEGEGGGGGGSCDLAQAVQRALRRDPQVRSAVDEANRSGKAIMLWNGDWVRSGGQEGKGLSAAREAVMWEVGFAPQACRNQRMHGLLLMSLADGGTRFAIGTGDWRWSDLLGVR